MWKKSLLFGLLLASLAACGQNVSVTIRLSQPTLVVSATPTPVFDFHTATLPPELYFPSPTPIPVLPQNPLQKPTDFSPVLYGGDLFGSTFFLLLGGVSRDGWFLPEVSVSRFAGEATYSLNSMQYQSKYFVWGRAPEFSPTCATYSIRTDADPDEAGFTAVLDGWSANKYPVAEVADQLYYQRIVDRWLQSQGIDSPQPGVLQVLETNLEADSDAEIFISATHLDASQHMTQFGDYSVILMLKVVDNEMVTTQVIGDVYRSATAELTFPRTYTLANFIDLNQDGVQEVVVDVHRWEGLGAIVYQVVGTQVIEVLRAEC